MAYGIEAFDARNPLAWPSFAKREDVEGLPPTVISVNECDRCAMVASPSTVCFWQAAFQRVAAE